MEDRELIQLFWERNEDAIRRTAEKYGGYCSSIAGNILDSREDAEECLNDTWLNAWNSIPPHRPQQLSTYLGKIVRNLAFQRYRREHAIKRGSGELPAVLDELADLVSGGDSPDRQIERQELVESINLFVRNLPPEKRRIFVRRYWYADPVKLIAQDCNLQEANVSKILERTRKALKSFLSERGFDL